MVYNTPESDNLSGPTRRTATVPPLSAEDYRLLIESMAQAVWETDATGLVLADSPGWRAYTGQTLEQWLANGWVPAVHPDEQANALQQWQLSLTTQTPLNATFRLCRADGGWRWTNLRAVPIPGPDGSVSKWMGLCIDISESYRTQERLYASEELLRTLIENLPGGAAFVVDRELRYLLSGGEGIKQVGLKSADFIGKSLVEAIGPDLARHHEPFYRQALHGSPFSLEHESLGRFFSTNGTPLYNNTQEPYAVLAVSYDITDRKRVEESLRESEARHTFQIRLNDRLRLLTDAVAIQTEAAHLLGEQLRASRVHYGEISEDDASIIIKQDYSPEVASLTGTFRVTDFGLALIDTLRAGQTLIVSDSSQSSLLTAANRATYAQYSVRAQVVIPLIKNHRLAAVLSVHQNEPRVWTANEVALIEETADRTWEAVERARIEGSLRESEARYRSLFETMDEGYFLCEMIFAEGSIPIDIVYVTVNPAATRMVGQDFTGRRLREINQGYESYWYEILGRVALTGQGERMERYAQPDQKWYDFYVFKVDGATNRVAVVFQDVTDRKRREANASFLAELQDDYTHLSSVDEIRQTLGEKIGRYMQVTTCTFLEMAGSRNDEMLVSYAWADTGFPNLQGVLHLNDLVTEEYERAILTEETIVIRDTQTDTNTHASAFATLKIGAFIGVPVQHTSELTYLLAVTDAGPRNWRVDEIELVQELANRIFPRLERARAEEALRQLEERTRIAVEAAQMGTWEWNLPNNEVYWNEQHFLLFGMHPHRQPLSSSEFMQHVHPDDLDRVVAELQQTITRKVVFDTEFRAVRDDGSIRWMSGYGRVTGETEGQTTRLNGVMYDINDRKQASEALRQSEERLRIVMESITDHALITTDTQHLITSWNTGAQKLFGYTAEEAIGQSETFIYTLEDQAAHVPESEARKARLEGQAANERYYMRKDGSRVYVSGVQSPLYDTQDRLLGYVTVARDLTERQQMEQNLRDADRRKDEFLAMLAHELRNPLAPIRNVLQTLQLTDAKEQAIKPAVTLMSRQVDHLVRLIDDLLDMSRISQGKIELRREQLDFGALVQEAAETVRPLYESSGRQLRVNVPSFPVYLQGDTTRLTQVMTNLLTNGARYTHPAGHVQVTLEVTKDHLAILRVVDDGIGLAADQLERIFDTFMQIDTSLDRTHGGLGLGLTLVKQLVERHGGQVEARSNGLGQGSEFIVTLPTLQKPIRPVPAAREPLTTGSPGLRILVVDDNRDAADTLAMLLKVKKHEVHVRYGGRDALEAAEHLQPRLILLDISMPEMDGYQTARLIRQQPWSAGIVLIALTGFGQAEDMRRSIEAGFDGHLVKPVDMPTLIQLLNSLSEEPDKQPD